MKDAFKRRSTLLIAIGIAIYVISALFPSVTSNGEHITVFRGYRIPILIGLAEFICAIANKKLVFILSIIQMIASICAFAINEHVLNAMQNDGHIISKGIIYYFPIVAWVLLLVGGIMFRKENAMNELSGGAQYFKRKSTIIICIGFILYVILVCIPAVTYDVITCLEAGYDVGGEVTPLLGFYYLFPVLIGLVELICALVNRKAVFVLSVIQTVVSVWAYAEKLMMLSEFKRDGLVVSYSNIVYLPIVASVLLLVGGIMFRKENAMNELSGGAQ